MPDSNPDPDGQNDARVTTITAEVKSLMVGSRQITLSVYRQLDWVPDTGITPMGRVTPKDAAPDCVCIVGRHVKTGALARSWLPVTTAGINKRVASDGASAKHEREAESCERRAQRFEEEAQKREDDAAGKLDKSYNGAAWLEERAEGYDDEARTADQQAATSIGADWLKSLAEAAQARYKAADCRDRAESARAEAAKLREEAAVLRTDAQNCTERAETLWAECEEAEARKEEECARVARVATEWSSLPLIVLAGLR